MIPSVHRTAHAIVITMGVIALVGCKNDALPGPSPREPDFVVSVTNGSTTPVYSWNAGNASSLRVVRANAISDVAWLITTETAAGDPVNNILSPTTHGITPSGAEVVVADELTLRPGISYEVTVGRTDGTAGFTVFTCCS